MNIFTTIEHKIIQAIYTGFDQVVDEQSLPIHAINVESPKDSAHGDFATNAAMVLAKTLKMRPTDIAGKIKECLLNDPSFTMVEIAGPGFLNMRLHPSFWYELLAQLLTEDINFGRSELGQNIKVNVEYVSANPTGPLHVGHCRGAVYGDALANLMAFAGYDVTKEYYMNDAGGQIGTLTQSAFLRYKQSAGYEIGVFPEGLYPGDYLIPVGEALYEQYNTQLIDMAEIERNDIIRPFVLDAMKRLIMEDLALFNIHHDIFFSEQSLHESKNGKESEIASMMEELRHSDLIYTGQLPPPKGKPPEDWEERDQTLFRSSNYGDDSDRALKKSNGSFTYFAADVAYFRSKFQRQFKQMIYVLGADHSGYAKRLEAVGQAVSDNKSQVIVRFCQLVKLLRGGEPIKMSKRGGTFITMRELVEEVGTDAVRFIMLFRKNDAPLDFDYQQVTEHSRDNPVFYVQYAHARCTSILRQAERELTNEVFTHWQQSGKADLSLLSDKSELTLIPLLARFPKIVEAAAQAQEPHRIAFYLHHLASEFHGHWNKGKDQPQLRYIQADNPTLTLARLSLVRAFQIVFINGLTILGVSSPDEM